jgi:hypothetical protein
VDQDRRPDHRPHLPLLLTHLRTGTLGLVTRLEDCPLPDGYEIPEPYIVTPDGVHLLKDDGAGYARVAWAWLFPVRVYVDPDGDQLVELTWRDGPRWVTRLIRRSLTKSGRKLIPLGLDSFTIDFSGRSGRGKTITAAAGLSCWADPSDRADGMLPWSTASIIGIEKRLNLFNGLVAVIDETWLVKDPALVDEVIYQVPKNRGKPRGGGWPNMIPWRVIAVSTGEQPATSFTTHQGASPRVLSIGGAPFGTDGDASRTAADSVKRGIEANFGTAGPAFVGRLQKRLSEDGGPGKLRGRHGELTELLRGSTDVSGRRAPLVACLALAAELAAERRSPPSRPRRRVHG